MHRARVHFEGMTVRDFGPAVVETSGRRSILGVCWCEELCEAFERVAYKSITAILNVLISAVPGGAECESRAGFSSWLWSLPGCLAQCYFSSR